MGIGSNTFDIYDLYSYELKTIIQSKLNMELLFDDYGLYHFNGKFYYRHKIPNSFDYSQLYLRRL